MNTGELNQLEFNQETVVVVPTKLNALLSDSTPLDISLSDLTPLNISLSDSIPLSTSLSDR